VHLIARGEEGYPERLAQIPRAPHLLYVQGKAFIGDALKIAVVGTRDASEYGLSHTRSITKELAGAGACIVSGLALGIDAAAHRGALMAGGRTIAVLGSALDRFYPPENLGLRDEILASGGSIVSEYPMGMPHTTGSFLQRNRIIAGLCAGTLVTEGPHRSGALRTAYNAADYGREVFALPGSVDAVGSQLPHRLIGEGAHLIACAADILQVLAPQLAGEILAHKREKTRAQEKPAPRADAGAHRAPAAAVPDDLPEESRAVLAALSGGEMEFDALSDAAGIDATSLGALLMELEMDGLIDALPGLRYARRA